MSSRSKRSKYQKRPEFPSEWSDWAWSTELRCSQRYRLTAPGQYEYEYGPVQPAEKPRTQPAMNTEFGSPGQYSTSSNYSYQFPGAVAPDPVASLARGLSRASLNPTHITPTDTTTIREASDPNYKVHGAFEFKFGKVFKVLWSEPRGDGGGQGTSSKATVTSVENDDGEKIHTKVRRFVVISLKRGHCICLPINTYSRKGVNKNGVHAPDHTIVYSGSKPKYFKGERDKGMLKDPIKIRCFSRHKLDDLSRLNYAKPYTVEYNVKVWFIGNVASECLDTLAKDYNETHPPIGWRDGNLAEEAEDRYSYAEGSSTYPGNYARAYEQETSVFSGSSPVTSLQKPRFSVPDEGSLRWAGSGTSDITKSSQILGTTTSQSGHGEQPHYEYSYQDSSPSSKVNLARGAYDVTDIRPYPSNPLPQPSTGQGSQYIFSGEIDEFALRDAELEDSENNPMGRREHDETTLEDTHNYTVAQSHSTGQSYYGHQYEHRELNEGNDYYAGHGEFNSQHHQGQTDESARYEEEEQAGPAPEDIEEQDLYGAD